MNAIEIKGLTKQYGAKTAVNALNLSVREGELLALLGVNGAGKTTTIKMLTGLIHPTAGDAAVMGHSILADIEAVKAISNASPQETAVAQKLTVRENLEFIAAVYGCGKEETSQRIADIEAQLGLAPVMNSRAATLSGGWQRRVSIAMALITKPQVLYLDEPTLGLDVLARRELWGVIRGLKGKATIILTTHYLEEAEALSDRVAIMANGRLKTVDVAERIIEASGQKNFEDAFVYYAAGGEGA